MENELDDLNLMMRKKNELLRRIEENRRLMELIKNPHIKDTLGPLKMMRRNIAAKKIQKYWREKKAQKKKNNNLNKNANFSRYPSITHDFSSISDFNSYLLKVLAIQKAFRRFLTRRKQRLITFTHVEDFNQQLFAPLKYERVNYLKNELVTNLKSKEMPSHNTDFTAILNDYYNKYKYFNEEFPYHVKLRNDIVGKYYQCINLIDHMATQRNLEETSKYDKIYIKKPEIKTRFEKITESIDQKMWWYKYRDVDDFEENNILNEIDSLYGFQKVGDILNIRK